MEFRSYADLSRTVLDNLWRVPPDVDVVVAVPRSGIIPATILALGLNLPTTDVEGLLSNRLISSGQTRRFRRLPTRISECRHALVIDDSVHTGANVEAVKQRLAPANLDLKVTFAAVYAAPDAVRHVDLHFEICSFPRLFEWNCFQPAALEVACVDLDTLLGLDHGSEQYDDQPAYREFLRAAVPHLRTDLKIYHLLTARLESHRAATEEWLHRHEIEYERLSMRAPSPGAMHATTGESVAYKAQIYRSDSRAQIFIGGDAAEARQVSQLSGKPAISLTDRQYFPRRSAIPRLGSAASGSGLRLALLARLKDWMRPQAANRPADAEVAVGR